MVARAAKLVGVAGVVVVAVEVDSISSRRIKTGYAACEAGLCVRADICASVCGVCASVYSEGVGHALLTRQIV